MTKVFLLLFLLLSPYVLLADGHIFVYHRFDDKRYPTTNISTQELRKEFNYLKNKFTVYLLDITLLLGLGGFLRYKIIKT